MNKLMLILRAIPGAGKSSLAQFLDHNLYCTAAIVSADDYFIDSLGEYNFDISKLHRAHEWAQAQAVTWCRHGSRCVIIDNTNTTAKEMKPYEDIAKEYGYKVMHLIVENRHGNESVHNVPDATLEKMRNRFEVKL